MTRLVAVVLACAASVDGAIEAEHPSDYVRVLEAGPPSLWDEAVVGLLGDDGELNPYAVRSVVRRVAFLQPANRGRVVRALRRHHFTLPALWRLTQEDPEPAVREAAMDSLLRSGAPGLMDFCRELIGLESANAMEALETLVAQFARWSERLEEGTTNVALDPVMDPKHGAPETIFDRRYLETVSRLLYAQDPAVRAAAVTATSSIDTPGLRDAWLVLTHDTDASVRWQALWALAETGDPRPCPILFDELSEGRDVERAGKACAPTHFLDYFERYQQSDEDAEFCRHLIEGGATSALLAEPDVMDAMASYASHPDPFLAATAQTLLGWQAARSEESAVDLKKGIQPALLVASALVSFVLGAILFVWAFRLYVLFGRVRHRPVAEIAALPLGPVALEGEVRPAGGLLLHPLTDERCVYYAGADADHPDARFYLVDDSGQVLVDPRRAVLFSDDGVLVTGERVHLVGHADREDGRVVIGKDTSPPPFYRRVGHWIIETLFGFGQKTSVSKMLFTDPSRCFWIWDDLERRPMGEARDVLWLAAGVVLAGSWILIFAVAVLGLIDREMSETLAEVLDALAS